MRVFQLLEAMTDLVQVWDVFGQRIRQPLQKVRITTLEQLTLMSEQELRKVPGLGKLSIEEIKKVMAAHGYKLALGIDHKRVTYIPPVNNYSSGRYEFTMG